VEKTPRGTTLVEVPQPRRFYRLTPKGREATDVQLSDPIMTIYHYPREQRSPKRRKYFQIPASRPACPLQPSQALEYATQIDLTT